MQFFDIRVHVCVCLLLILLCFNSATLTGLEMCVTPKLSLVGGSFSKLMQPGKSSRSTKLGSYMINNGEVITDLYGTVVVERALGSKVRAFSTGTWYKTNMSQLANVVQVAVCLFLL